MGKAMGGEELGERLLTLGGRGGLYLGEWRIKGGNEESQGGAKEEKARGQGFDLQEGNRMKIVLVIILAALVVVAVFLIVRLLQSKKTYRVLQDKYKDITDRDAEIQKRETKILELSQKQSALEDDHKKKLQALNDDYAKYKGIYDNLRKELSVLEENLEIQSFGLYKPHYDFTTSEEYKVTLEENYEKQKSLIKQDSAARCTKEWSVEGSKREGERMTKQYTKLMLRAFNGECDASILKVRWNNVGIMDARIRKAFEVINKLGTVWNIFITQDYLDLKIQELRLTHELEEKLNREKEEQRRIHEQMREEEKVQREIEQAKEKAEDEEKQYQKALEKARAELDKAKGAELDELNEKIKGLEQQLGEAQELKERAISRAQLTKSGHVYVISNIGSLGENIFKIGMTRRLEPFDRIKELGDASVPFGFDVHAMVFSENAPELEGKLHDYFERKRVNLVNERKEFFNVTIDELEQFAKANNLGITITKLAEAKEFRETLTLRQQTVQEAPIPEPSPFPTTLVE